MYLPGKVYTDNRSFYYIIYKVGPVIHADGEITGRIRFKQKIESKTDIEG